MADVGSVEAVGSTVEPPEMTSFDSFSICDPVRQALRDMGYDTPTEVQARVLEVVQEGRDLVVQSKTGSGKTSAFGIPLVERIEKGAGKPGVPQALILVPTRELANQVAEEIRKLSKPKGLRVLAVYGGVSLGRQIAGLRAGVEIVVGTPGRLLDHIRRRNLTLKHAQTVVLDEADEMLSMGFWEDVTRLIGMAPDDKQTMMFSATLPYEVAKTSAEHLRDPVRVDLSGDDLTVEGIENCIVHMVADTPKPRQLLSAVETMGPRNAIVFCNTRNETEMIAKYLTQLGLVAEPLSGNLRQKERDRVMNRIKSGDLRFMVATDVASRGIDISDLSHVFNYSLPEFPEVYLHRVGRTGRLGKTGAAVSLVDGPGLATLRQLENQFGITFQEKTLPPQEEVLRLRSQRIMKELAEKASVAEVGQHLPVAEEILKADDSAQVIAYLLKSYFNAQAERGRRSRPAPEAQSNDNDVIEIGSNGQPRRRRRRRRRRRPGGQNGSFGDTMSGSGRGGMRTSDRLPPPVVGQQDNQDIAPEVPKNIECDEDGMARVRVNIGFDDGFKGKGAVAKKISSLAGLNEGIITELEARREFAVLRASPEVAELLIERVDGAQIGKKILNISVS